MTNSDLSKIKPEILSKLEKRHSKIEKIVENDVQYYDDLRSNVVALKYESCLKENAVIISEANEKKYSLNVPQERPMLRKPSFIEFTPYSSSLKSKKEISATKKSSRKSSSHNMEMINEFETKNNDEILEEHNKIPTPKKHTKKNLFEEFLLIGIDKTDFLKIESDNESTKGYLTPKIMFEHPQDPNESKM